MKKITTEDIIKKFEKVHDYLYDYSLVVYINDKTKVDILCKEHGLFKQSPNRHLRNHGCPKCNGGIKLTRDEFITNSKIVHGEEYDYSLVVYINNNTKIDIICKKHGIFKQTPSNHINHNKGCPKCNGGIKLTKDEFIYRSNKIHDYKFDYSSVIYINIRTKVKIICPIHGEFEQLPSIHLRHNGCPYCKESKGERKIKIILKENDILYEQQKKFIGCKNKLQLSFDFYLSEYNTCIEFNGKQHYESVDYFGGNEQLKKQIINDKIKQEYCKENNIELIRIKYNENIKLCLEKVIKNKK